MPVSMVVLVGVDRQTDKNIIVVHPYTVVVSCFFKVLLRAWAGKERAVLGEQRMGHLWVSPGTCLAFWSCLSGIGMILGPRTINHG